MSRARKGTLNASKRHPKGFQKVSRKHENDVQKASSRHPNSIGNSIRNSIGNSIGRQISNLVKQEKSSWLRNLAAGHVLANIGHGLHRGFSLGLALIHMDSLGLT